MSKQESQVEKELREMYEAGMASRPEPGREYPRGPIREQLKERAKKKAANKRQVTARFDAEVVERYQELAGDGSYQRLMNQALREWLEKEQLEDVVRRVLREELFEMASFFLSKRDEASPPPSSGDEPSESAAS